MHESYRQHLYSNLHINIITFIYFSNQHPTSLISCIIELLDCQPATTVAARHDVRRAPSMHLFALNILTTAQDDASTSLF